MSKENDALEIENKEKPKNFKITLLKLIKEMKPYYIWLIIIILFSILGTIFTIVGPKVLGNATTELYEGVLNKISGTGGINFNKIYKILITMVVLYIISAVFNYIQGIIMATISQKYTKNLRTKVNKKINKLPMNYFDKKNTGEILSLITNDIDTIGQNLNQAATELITCIVMVIGILIMMFSINVGMTIITLIILPISIILSALFVGKSQKHFLDQQNLLASVNGSIEEMLSGHTVVKAFNASDKVINNFNDYNTKLAEAAWKSNFISGLMNPIMTLVGNIGYVIVAILGAINVLKGRITVGNIQSFITYTKNFTNPIGDLASILTELQGMVAASERVFEFLNETEEKPSTNKIKLNEIKGEVEFKNVKFGYTEDKIIINNFSTKVKSGKKIAIVGPTGSGKTTLVKLLMRFYDVKDGEILIDGINIKDIDRSELRRKFGMVLQDTWLFSGSIMENLRYGKLDATDDEVIDASKTAYVHHFIQTLPDGYNMVLNEDTNNISGGQKQLLTIARAILADPKILILDEATSSVDTRTEVLIQKAMDKLMKNRTSFIIAHRLSTIQNADLILVLKDGDIIEQGTHEDLLKKKGFYSTLYSSQFENN